MTAVFQGAPVASYAQKVMKSAKPSHPHAPICCRGATACATVTGSSTLNAHIACTVQNTPKYNGNLDGPVSQPSLSLG